MAADEAELMTRYCDGEAAAFRALYAALAPRLLGYLVRMAHDRALAEDLLQVTFLKLHRSRASYVRGANPLPWVYAIAHRTFLDEMRRRKRSKVQLARQGADVPEPEAHITGKAAAEVQEPAHDPELVKATMAALDQLPDKQREAVVLTKLSGKSVAEAAEIAGTTVGAMKVRAHRGYAALRKVLEPTT